MSWEHEAKRLMGQLIVTAPQPLADQPLEGVQEVDGASTNPRIGVQRHEPTMPEDHRPRSVSKGMTMLASVNDITVDSGRPVSPSQMQRKLRDKRKQLKDSGALTQKQEEAAVMLAEDELEEKAICKKLGVNTRALWRWKKIPAFDTRVKLEIAILAEAALSRGIARKDRRLKRLDGLVSKIDDVIRERGKSREMKNVAGGKTGLVYKKMKGVAGVPMAEYVVDNPTIQTVIELQREAAEETGQRIKKQEVTGSGGTPLIPPKLVLNFVTPPRTE